MTILAVETSCDDTAAAVICDGRVLSNVVSSQVAHREFGGIVPEIASRAHQRYLVPVVKNALNSAGKRVDEIDAVAATFGPGLAGSLLVGLSFAKAIAAARGIPFVAINHLEGHLFSPFAEGTQPHFPFLALVVSGGHTELLTVRSWHDRTRLGRTRDDAAGEAFDKVGKMLGLPYPGGPAIEQAALTGDALFHSFPRTSLPDYAFSFSGIKTSVLYHLKAFTAEERGTYLGEHMNDLAASFQSAMTDMILAPLDEALSRTGIRTVSLSGGVSSNSQLRTAATRLCDRYGASIHIAPAGLRTDNAAMIGLVAYYRMRSGQTSPLSMTINPSAELA